MKSTTWMLSRGSAGYRFVTGLLICFGAITPSARAQVTLPAAGIINTVAGDGSWTFSGDGGPATSAAMEFPSGVAVDTAGNIYIADTYNERVREVSAATGIINTIAGTGTAFSYYPNNGDDLPATDGFLNDPTGIAVDSAGNVYIADTANQRIRKITAATGIISTVAGDGYAGHTGDGGAATSAELYDPNGIAVDAAGNLYIGDTGNNVVRKVTAATGIITTVAGNGIAGYIDNTAATSGELNAPYGVAVDNSNNIYISDAKNNVVRKVTAATGIISTVAGYGPAGYSGDNGAAVNAELDDPIGVAVNAAGDLYITDFLNQRVREVRGATQIITTVAGTGTGGYSGDNGAAASAELSGPSGVAVDYTGNVYIGDMYNNRVRAVGVPPLVLGTYDPHYQVTSILYAAPGNKSSSGLTDSASAGASLTVTGSIFSDTMIGIPWGGGGVEGGGSTKIGVKVTADASNQIMETWSNAASIVNESNPNSPDAINHNQDLFLIWLNQSISIWYQDSVPVYYNIGVQGGALPDIVQIFADTMEANASGQTTVPAVWLNQQVDPVTGVKTPGLAALCQDILAAEYAAGACTLEDQCGCTPSDFAPVLALDPLLNYTGTQSPLQANVSPASICGVLPVLSGNCRYVPVPAAVGSTLQEIQTLSGPQTQGGNSNCNSFTQSDNTSDTVELGGSVEVSVAPFEIAGTSETIGLSAGFSVGAQAGVSTEQNVTLCSATVGCGQDVAVYEDTAFHTFVYQQPPGNNSCSAP